MKRRKISPINQRSKGRVKSGFALIATISVMVLLVMIALAMLSLSTIEMRQGGRSSAQQIAQANARMALMMAIGELQKYAGPDTRVTANESVENPSSPNPYWVNVYKTRPDEDLLASTPVSGNFVVDHHESKLYLTDNRVTSSGKYKRPKPVARLVSGNMKYSPDQALTDEQSVVILDTGEPATSVRVPLIKVGDSSQCAYWVSDNSVKLLYNKSNPYKNNGSSSPSASNEEFYNASISQSPYLDDLQIGGTNKLSSHSSTDYQVLQKGITLNTSRLLFSDLSHIDIKKSFHLLSSDSAAVFSNPIVGGLKPDMTPFIETGDIKPTGADLKKGLPELLTTTPIIKGKHHHMTSPRFGILKDWADMRFRLSSASGAATISPQVSPDSFRQNFSDSLSLKRRDLTQVKSNYLQPVVVEASLGWDFSPYTSGGGEKLRTHIFPRLILWNPYNVTLSKKKYIMLANLPYKGDFHYRGKNLQIKFYELLGMPKGARGWAFPGFVTVPVSLAPGECKVFSPDMSHSGGTLLAGIARRFDSSNINNNVLSPDKPPGVENFYWDSNKTLEVAETPANRYKPYGFTNNSNNFFSWYNLKSDEYIILQSRSNINGSLRVRDLETKDDFETISHFLAENNSEQRYGKWYAAQNSQHPVNGTLYFKNITRWSPDRLPPRLWRRGIRLQWYDESAEGAAVPGIYPQNACRLATPLVATTNLHGGILNHPSPLGVRVQQGWQVPNLNSHIYFRQPTDPGELKSFFPPSPIGRPSDGYPTKIVLFDLPRINPGIFSLGQFQSAEFSYLPWHPSYILGSSYSTEQADLDATALRDRKNQTGAGPAFLVTDPNRWNSSSQGSGFNWGHRSYYADHIIQRGSSENNHQQNNEVLVYDIAYELNHAFWDGYMLSSIPYKGKMNSRKANWDGKTPLPVSHYIPRDTQKLSLSKIVDKVKTSPEFTFYHAAEFLFNQGALSVNCDNKEVWKAFLLSLKDKKHPNLRNQSGSGGGNNSITRSILPQEGGASPVGSSMESKAWNGFRSLTDSEIDRLAEEIVKQVRERGPFLSMSDFINRRLNKSDNQNYDGAMQAAIDAVGINANLEEKLQGGSLYDGDQTNEVAKDLTTIKNRVDYKSALLPGYFSQNDLLTVLAPSLTARGDTFTIRAYGEARDASGKNVLARAYCEAVVQRMPEYVDPTDDAVEPVRIYDEANHTWKLNISSGVDRGLSKTNLRFGRRFKIIKFRWLSRDEV